MSFSTSNILFVLSGGISNLHPANSIGGPPSSKTIGNGIDFLFPQVTTTEETSGSTIYRCIYIFNQNNSTMSNVTLWLTDTGLTSVAVGVLIQNEIQTIIIGGSPTGGTFSLTYTGSVNGVAFSQTTSLITWSSNASTTATNIQTALNSLSLLGGVIVSGSGTTYTITFAGINGNRDHALLQVAANNITGSNVTLTTNEVQAGAPINAIAPNIGFQNQTPFGIVFSTPTSQATGITIGTLDPLDIFYIWLKRTVPSGINAGSSNVDSAIVNIFANVFQM